MNTLTIWSTIPMHTPSSRVCFRNRDISTIAVCARRSPPVNGKCRNSAQIANSYKKQEERPTEGERLVEQSPHYGSSYEHASNGSLSGLPFSPESQMRLPAAPEKTPSRSHVW